MVEMMNDPQAINIVVVAQQQQERHPMEAIESWEGHQQQQATRQQLADDAAERRNLISTNGRRRFLKHHHPSSSHHHDDHDYDEDDEKHAKEKRERKELKRLDELYTNPGIRMATVHGMMIDAGSTGSRLHVYEWKPRNLYDVGDIESVASGTKLSFPGTNTRWTDRLRPGLATFATIQDDIQLVDAIADYLAPLLEFAKTILHEKRHQFNTFPIYLRATAGMRMLTTSDRARVMNAVRSLLANPDYNPFSFDNEEQARVLSGEEEAVYDWTAVNFLTGDLLAQSQGTGVVTIDVLRNQRTHGALDLGGASTQISFYQPANDIMANLFKLQIGQAKHWNIYAHSFLFFGMNEALDRFHASLLVLDNDNEKHHDDNNTVSVNNPCLPKDGYYTATTDIVYDKNGMEGWNDHPQRELHFTGRADYAKCLDVTTQLLHLAHNSWCDFAHRGDCSLAGVYQPALPDKDNTDFVAFSNYYTIWQFLQLDERATIGQLEIATKEACGLSWKDLQKRKGLIEDDEDVATYCFRSVYAFQLLHKGYGFSKDRTIQVSKVLNGQKVGWALGAMLYEINTLPWHYVQPPPPSAILSPSNNASFAHETTALMVMVALASLLALVGLLWHRERRLRHLLQYEPIKDVAVAGGGGRL